jgi:hypothetical protein
MQLARAHATELQFNIKAFRVFTGHQTSRRRSRYRRDARVPSKEERLLQGSATAPAKAHRQNVSCPTASQRTRTRAQLALFAFGRFASLCALGMSKGWDSKCSLSPTAASIYRPFLIIVRVRRAQIPKSIRKPGSSTNLETQLALDASATRRALAWVVTRFFLKKTGMTPFPFKRAKCRR